MKLQLCKNIILIYNLVMMWEAVNHRYAETHENNAKMQHTNAEKCGIDYINAEI